MLPGRYRCGQAVKRRGTTKNMTERILLIDAGNTRIKLGWVDATTGQRESQAIAVVLGQPDSLEKAAAQLPKGCRYAVGVSVAASQTLDTLQQWLVQVGVFSGPVQWLQSTKEVLNVHSAYQPVEQLGTDRWVAMLGLAWHERQQAKPNASRFNQHSADPRVILATFGTATTIDTLAPRTAPVTGDVAVVPADTGLVYEFLGGLILPGPDMMLRALSLGTANLPMARAQEALYPTNTQQAIVSGVLGAQAGALLRQWQAAVSATGIQPKLYTSGGAWPKVQTEVQRLLEEAAALSGKQLRPLQYLSSPVLDGLACIALNH